jgi:hypothetical protein
MVRFICRGSFVAETPFQQLVTATAMRSTETFKAVLHLLEASLPAPAAMLTRPLFEDLIVGHWLLLNREDADWLVDRFFRHRNAIAIHQRRVERETTWSMAPPLPTDPGFASQQNDLLREFGGEAQKNWWDPGTEGNGKGAPVGIREIAARLEKAAADGMMFAPRFAGGQESLLKRMEQAAYKWFTQFLHHTAIGLPAQPMRSALPIESPDPSGRVLFLAGWTFAQQAYLLHDLYGEDPRNFDHLFAIWFIEGFGASLDELNWPYTYNDEENRRSRKGASASPD